jgi:putative transposase
MLNLIDEFTRECLAIRPGRRLNSRNVIEVLGDAMIERGIPEHIRSDNVLTRERKVGGKKRFLSIPYGMKMTVSPSGFHMQGRSDRP